MASTSRRSLRPLVVTLAVMGLAAAGTCLLYTSDAADE